MAHNFEVYPCSKDGKLLKGFCLTQCDGNGVMHTVAGYRRFSKKFGIEYYAFRCISLPDMDFTVVSLNL